MSTARTGPTSASAQGSPGPTGSDSSARSGQSRPAAATTVGALSALSVVAATLMAVAHAGITIPVVSAIGPDGGDAVWPAAIVFGLGALLFAGLTAGALAVARWTWPAAVVVNALAALSMVQPYRGLGSLLGIVLFGATLVVLLSPAGRSAFRR